MTADTYDPILGLLLMGTGNDNNAWGANLNNSGLTPIAKAIAGVNTITATSGTVDLSTTVPPAGLRLDVHAVQLANGALTGDLTIQVPNVSKIWRFENATSGNFNMYVKVPNGVSGSTPGVGGLVQIPQGKTVNLMCDGNGNLYRGDRHEIGTFIHHAGTTAPAGAMATDGASKVRTEFPDLYNAIGVTWGSVDSVHFTLPKLTDTNRFLRAADGTTITVGTYQSNQNQSHTHTATSSLSGAVTDSQGSHTHSVTISDPTHSHGVTGGTQGGSANLSNTGQGGSTNVPAGTTAIVISYAATGISASTATAGAHTHNVSGTVTTTNASQGGTEARPESAAALICIRY